jgi:integrase
MSLQLPNHCRIGKISVHPANWLDVDADPTIEWYIHYRFHDPNYRDKYPKGYPVKRRNMNDIPDLATRRRVVKGLLENEKKNLLNGYNAILNKFVEANELEISPAAPFLTALDKVYKLLPATKAKNEVRKALVYIRIAIIQLRYDGLPIGEVRRRHIVAILEKISRNKEEAASKPWGASSFNHYRSYFIMLFKQLDICEAAELNLEKVPMRKGIKKRRIMPSDEQLQHVDRAIRDKFYAFWRFIHIFHRSGARMAELMQVRLEDIDLAEGKFFVIVRKRNGDAEQVEKTIMRGVASLWEEVVAEASPGEYLFARGLKPGPVAINERQVTKRWRVHIKKKLGITADFYSLKKKNSTEVVSKELEKIRQAQQAAADQNSHKGTAMVQKHYDDLNDQRLHHQLRAI